MKNKLLSLFLGFGLLTFTSVAFSMDDNDANVMVEDMDYDDFLGDDGMSEEDEDFFGDFDYDEALDTENDEMSE